MKRRRLITEKHQIIATDRDSVENDRGFTNNISLMSAEILFFR
jgi:hypothetical protein